MRLQENSVMFLQIQFPNRPKKRILKKSRKKNIANYVKIIWRDGSYCIENNTDYTLEKVSVMTSWTQFVNGEIIGYQEPRQFTYIPAHSKSTSIEYNKYIMNNMKGQIYEIKCSALGLH